MQNSRTTCVVAPLGELVLVIVQQLFDVVVGRTTLWIDRLNDADLNKENGLGRGRFDLKTNLIRGKPTIKQLQ
jgi:hypothetical protein